MIIKLIKLRDQWLVPGALAALYQDSITLPTGS